jgi:hypothetical protein
MHLHILDEWGKNLDTHSDGHVHVLSLDLGKAFGNIRHSRLILKLQKFGI